VGFWDVNGESGDGQAKESKIIEWVVRPHNARCEDFLSLDPLSAPLDPLSTEGVEVLSGDKGRSGSQWR
jgi:hypothetical protein